MNYRMILDCLILGTLSCMLLACKEREESKVELWMTYDEVLKELPHDRERLMRNPTASHYVLSEEEKRVKEFYGVNLEEEYGVILGFNEQLELVFINRITRAK